MIGALPGFESTPSPYRHQPSPALRLREEGPAALSDLELLAALAGGVEPAAAMLDRFGSLRGTVAAGVVALEGIPGIGAAVAARIAAVAEVAARAARERTAETGITSPEDVYAYLGPAMRDLPQESVRVILLNHRKKVIRTEEIFRGTGNESFANPAEILRSALLHCAPALVLVHNHPSGDPSPSRADHEVTRRLHDACKALGVELTDHIVIGRPNNVTGQPWFSFREAGLL